MGESKFKKLKMELAVVQSHMFIVDEDRPRVLRAMNGLGIADEMYEMLEDLAMDYHCECGHKSCRIERTRKEIDDLLAKARGEG